MVDHVVTAVQDAEELAVTVKELLVLAVMTQNEIASSLKVSRRFVQKIAREIKGDSVTQSLKDPTTSNALEDQFVRKCQATLKQIKPKTDTAAELKNKAQAAGVLFDKARLAAGQSTANVAHRSLSSLVSRRPPVPKVSDVPKVTTEPAAKALTATAVDGPLDPMPVPGPAVFPLKGKAAPEPLI